MALRPQWVSWGAEHASQGWEGGSVTPRGREPLFPPEDSHFEDHVGVHGPHHVMGRGTNQERGGLSS